MKTQKCKMRQKHCSCIHRCNNKSSLKGGMHHNTADSLWNCLSQRLAQIGLIPHDVGGSDDCFFKSVSHQLYGTADLHVEVRMARITHLHNYPELYIEMIPGKTILSKCQYLVLGVIISSYKLLLMPLTVSFISQNLMLIHCKLQLPQVSVSDGGWSQLYLLRFNFIFIFVLLSKSFVVSSE